MSFLFILAPLILLSALGAAALARPVHAALMLALSLAFVAVLYIALGADFIGLVQFLVYIGAVAILIVFGLLLTRPADEAAEAARSLRTQLFGLFCALPVAIVLLNVVASSPELDRAATAPQNLSVAAMGISLFTTHAAAVLAVGVMLTAVLVGAAMMIRDTDPEDLP